jgi:hypothetical protein
MIYSILFTGHMIDTKDREHPRFPVDKESVVREEIKNQLIVEKKKIKGGLKGVASGACGGDILFHELCKELGIQTEIYLGSHPDEFKKASVSFAGKTWDNRFDKLALNLPIHILPDDYEKNTGKNAYERTNLWMLNAALENGGKNMALIALWDRKGGDGKGGTAHMIKLATEQGAEIVIIDINTNYRGHQLRELGSMAT